MSRQRSGFETFVEHWHGHVAFVQSESPHVQLGEPEERAGRISFELLIAQLLPNLTSSQVKKAKTRMPDEEVLGRLLSAYPQVCNATHFIENPRCENAERWKPRLRKHLNYGNIHAAIQSIFEQLTAYADEDAEMTPLQLLVDEDGLAAIDTFYERFRNPLVDDLRKSLSGMYVNNLARVLDQENSLAEQAATLLFVSLCKDEAMRELVQDDVTVSRYVPGNGSPLQATRGVIGAHLVQYIPNESGADAENIIDVSPATPCNVGRSCLGMPPGNSTWYVSRRHAVVSCAADGTWTLRDCSTWGTAVAHGNAIRVLSSGDECALSDGDRIWLAPDPEAPSEETAYRNGAVLRFELRYGKSTESRA